MRKKTIKVDLIECARGWQGEFALGKNWTCYSAVYRDREKCVAETEKLARNYEWVLVWEREGE